MPRNIVNEMNIIFVGVKWVYLSLLGLSIDPINSYQALIIIFKLIILKKYLGLTFRIFKNQYIA